MPNPTGFITSLLRKWSGNRRQVPRHDVQLEVRLQAHLLVSITLPQTQTEIPESLGPGQLIGSTRNVSETGLAIVVPSLRVGTRRITEENCTLNIVLDIYPAGLIDIDAVLVHHQRLDEKEKHDGYLIGVRITKMSDGDRNLYLGYLDILKDRASRSSGVKD